MSEDGFGECNSYWHKKITNSKVAPLDDLRKVPGDPNSAILKSCIKCRVVQRGIEKKHNDKKAKCWENSPNSSFKYCTEGSHVKNSLYPVDKVPIHLFRKFPDNPDSALAKRCVDCRQVSREYCKTRISKKKENADDYGMFYCTNCHKNKTFDERAKNEDESWSILCKKCKKGEKKRSLGIRQLYKDIKLEMIFKYKRNCRLCDRIFIKSENSSTPLIIIQRYKENNRWYIDWEDEKCRVRDFVNKYSDKLELGAIELDHVPEEETLGRLSKQPENVTKIRNVSKMSSESAMRFEAEKCWHLCSMCHLEETIRRERGTEEKARSKLERQKLVYVNNIKRAGCSVCSFYQEGLERFLHFDHIDPRMKTSEISRMTKDNNYTYTQLTEECNKCRVLCKFCHMIHTAHQRKMGVI